MKKAFLVFLLVSLGLFFFSGKTRANVTDPQWKEGVQANINTGDLNSSVYSFNQQDNLWSYWNCMLRGNSVTYKNCPTDPNKPEAFNTENSVIGKVNNGIAMLYRNPSADTAQYIAYLKNQVGIVTPAYAQQGIGFPGLTPILDVWKSFRNIAYGFIIIVLIMVGFMIMFRWKIDPRTVITIQGALPRIIVTLILITFSYAIVGLMIDFMYVVIYVAMFALGKTNPVAVQQYTGGALTHLIWGVFTTGMAAVDDIANFIGLGVDKNLISDAISSLNLGTIADAIGFLIGKGIVGVPVTIIMAVFVSLALVIMMIRIFFMLLSAWVQVLISLIFGPIQLMFGAIPGVNTFGSWFKNLISNLAVFPITVILLLIGSILSHTAKNQSLWAPPGLGGAKNDAIAGIIGLAIIMIIPSIVNNFKQAIKAISLIPAGPGAAFGPLGAAYGTATGGLMQLYYLNMLTGKEGMLSKIFRRGQKGP